MTTCCSLTMSLWPKPKSPTFTRKLQLINPPSSFTHHLSFPIPSLPHRKSCFIRLSSSSSVTSMDSISGLSNEVAQDFSPYLKIYKDGRVERLSGTDIVPTSFDPQSGVESKDAVISPGVSARLYIPKSKIATNPAKLPLLVYYHGGGFCMGSPFCAYYNSYVTSLVAEANVVAVSVDYRKAPENPLPIGYDDSWDALKWIQSHVDGKGPEDWLNSHADFERVFFAGDSAGANIAHHMALRVGFDGLLGVKLKGIALVHPYFWGSEPIDGETEVAENRGRAEAIWRFSCPSTVGADDPLINPGKDPKLGNIEAEKVLVCVAELDVLRQRGFCYSELLKESGCGGDVEVVESKGEDHVFHLNNPVGENSVALLKKIASFFNA